MAARRPEEARAIQHRVRAEVLHHFARKLAIAGFEQDERVFRFLLDYHEN